MSDRIIQGFSEMKNIYLTQILTEEKNEGEDYGEKYEKNYKKSGKKSKDYDGDGEVEDEADEYAGVKDKSIRKAMGKDEDGEEKPSKKKKKEDEEEMNESFSNWRQDLYEVISKLENEPKVRDIDNDTITEKSVNNKVVINPPVTEKFQHILTQELDEEFITETVVCATEHFYTQGLNEHGLDIVVEELGIDKFIEYVFYISEDYLLNEKTIDVNEVSKKITIDRGNRYVCEAVQCQKKSKRLDENARNAIAGGILKAMDLYQSGMARHREANKKLQSGLQSASERHKKAIEIAKPVGEKALKGLGHVAGEFATGVETAVGKRNLRSGELTTLGKKMDDALNKKSTNSSQTFGSKKSREKSIKNADAIAKAKAEIEAREAKNKARSEARRNKKKSQQTNESIQYILEKATSEQQQKIFGLALSVKRGDTPRSEVSDEVLKIVDGVSTAEIRKFASTKHKGLPHRKEE